MPMGKSKMYSVKSQGDGLSLKERYQQFLAAKVQAVREIGEHDPKMAAAALRLLSVGHEHGRASGE